MLCSFLLWISYVYTYIPSLLGLSSIPPSPLSVSMVSSLLFMNVFVSSCFFWRGRDRERERVYVCNRDIWATIFITGHKEAVIIPCKQLANKTRNHCIKDSAFEGVTSCQLMLSEKTLKELIITELLIRAFSYEFLSCLLPLYCGEGNGTPFQYSCLENPMDGGAW